MGTGKSGRNLNTKGGQKATENIPTGWHVTDFFHGIAILRPDNPNQTLSLPRTSEIPNVSYLLYGKNGVFKQLRIFGADNRPKMDIDYHMKDGTMSLHKHIYVDGVRQKEHIELNNKEYNDYKKFLEKVFDK